MKKLYIVGSGGHGSSALEAFRSSKYSESMTMAGFLSDTDSKRQDGLPFVGPAVPRNEPGARYFIAIGENHGRESVAKRFSPKDVIAVAHGTAVVHSTTNLGTFVGAQAYIGPRCVIGIFSIINTGVILEHDCTVGAFSHLAPGVVVGGYAKIGHFTQVGLGAIIRDRVSIGSNVIIGMGSNVTGDIPDGCVAWGNPCRIIRKNAA